MKRIKSVFEYPISKILRPAYWEMVFYRLIDITEKAFRKNSKGKSGPSHLIFLFTDHFEPGDDLSRVEQWISRYKDQTERYYDSDGVGPQHSWFYPCEQLNHNILNLLSKASFDGLGEIELHLHHKDDTSESLKKIISDGLASYSRAGAFVDPHTFAKKFAFIHGDWALDNSRSKNGVNYCGVNDELTILKELGCYADFTFPSLEEESQPRKINRIYYATDDPLKPKSYNGGEDVCSLEKRSGDLMLVQGPWVYNLARRKFGIFPYVECGDIASYFPANPDRIKLWIEANVSVLGRPEWKFIKIHAHSAARSNMDAILGSEMAQVHSALTARYNDGKDYLLHYVTAREAYNIIKAAEDGHDGNPGDYRDYVIGKPLNRSLYSDTLYDIADIDSELYELRFKGKKQVKVSIKTDIIAEISGEINCISLHKHRNDFIKLDIRSSASIISNKKLDIVGNFTLQEDFMGKDEVRYSLNGKR